MDEFRVKYLDWYKWNYENELKRKDEIDKLMAFPVTILSIFAGTAYFIIRQYLDNWDRVPSAFDGIFFVACALFVGIFLVAAFFLIRVFYKDKREYLYLSTLEGYDKYIKDDLIANNPPPSDEPEVRSEHLDRLREHFELKLIEQYSEFSSHNARINDGRTEDYYRARKSLVYSYVIFVLLSTLGLLNFFLQPKKDATPTPPTIYNIYTNMSEKKPDTQQPRPQAPQTPITSTPPPGRIIREHQEKKIERKVVPPPPNKK